MHMKDGNTTAKMSHGSQREWNMPSRAVQGKVRIKKAGMIIIMP